MKSNTYKSHLSVGLKEGKRRKIVKFQIKTSNAEKLLGVIQLDVCVHLIMTHRK